MSETVTTPAPKVGLFGRFFGMLTSPRATFESVIADPKPAHILLVTTILIALAAGIPQFTERGHQATVQMQIDTIERMTGRPITDEMRAGMDRGSAYAGYSTIASIIVSVPIVSLIFAGLYYVLFNAILGGAAVYKQVLAIVTHSSVIGAIGAALGAPLMYMKGTFSASGPFNLGVLAPMLEEKTFLAQFLGSTNIFTVWGLIVTSIGFSVLYRRKAGNIAIGLLLVYACIISGFAYFLSR